MNKNTSLFCLLKHSSDEIGYFYLTPNLSERVYREVRVPYTHTHTSPSYTATSYTSILFAKEVEAHTS